VTVLIWDANGTVNLLPRLVLAEVVFLRPAQAANSATWRCAIFDET
jgi:hypothetical protein